MSTPASNLQKPAVRVFVATTVMLTFISFWRAAAIVLSDLASSAYYVGGDAEKVIGKSAPWFVLAVMLFANAVRAVYIESSAMFVRGGVYRVVKQAMGGTLAKLSVSALLFDYILTGPDQRGRRRAVSRRVPERHAPPPWLRQVPHHRRPVCRRYSPSRSRFTSGGRTPKASTNPANAPCRS